jgi:hypothetical protein
MVETYMRTLLKVPGKRPRKKLARGMQEQDNMRCAHCDEPATKKTPMKVCPMRDTNPPDHNHPVCQSCFKRMTADAPPEPETIRHASVVTRKDPRIMGNKGSRSNICGAGPTEWDLESKDFRAELHDNPEMVRGGRKLCQDCIDLLNQTAELDRLVGSLRP